MQRGEKSSRLPEAAQPGVDCASRALRSTERAAIVHGLRIDRTSIGQNPLTTNLCSIWLTLWRPDRGTLTSSIIYVQDRLQNQETATAFDLSRSPRIFLYRTHPSNSLGFRASPTHRRRNKDTAESQSSHTDH